MVVPLAVKDIRARELQKIAVKADFRHPVDDIEYVFVADAPLNGDASVTVRRPLPAMHGTLRGALLHEFFPLLGGIKETAAEFAEKRIDAQQSAARIRRKDLAFPRVYINFVFVLRRRSLACRD